VTPLYFHKCVRLNFSEAVYEIERNIQYVYSLDMLKVQWPYSDFNEILLWMYDENRSSPIEVCNHCREAAYMLH
jgi:hypothetical protein